MRSSLIVALFLPLCAGTFLSAADPYGGIDPYWMLLHEPAVVAELRMSDAQRTTYRKALDELDGQFFPLRNKSAQEGAAGLEKIVEQAKRQLSQILSREQGTRLNEILLQRLGTAAFRRDDFAERLKLAEKQRFDIRRVLDETQQEVSALEKEAAGGKPREPLEKRFTELKTEEQKKIVGILSAAQRTAWKDSLGRAFDLSRLGQPAMRAPELIDSGVRIHSAQPVQLAKLRDKVVVLHFYAFGCINCIHNYPVYRDWQEKFQGKDVVMIGIHTPETSAEREVAAVRRKATEEKFAFPILVDGENANWNAWGNSMWPSVYVIDKRGYVRSFWPGELKWQGAKGDEILARKIEELLTEK